MFWYQDTKDAAEFFINSNYLSGKRHECADPDQMSRKDFKSLTSVMLVSVFVFHCNF